MVEKEFSISLNDSSALKAFRQFKTRTTKKIPLILFIKSHDHSLGCNFSLTFSVAISG